MVLLLIKESDLFYFTILNLPTIYCYFCKNKLPAYEINQRKSNIYQG